MHTMFFAQFTIGDCQSALISAAAKLIEDQKLSARDPKLTSV